MRKNTVLKTVAWINFVVFIIFACCLDSDDPTPFIACCLTGAYLALFAIANNFFEN